MSCLEIFAVDHRAGVATDDRLRSVAKLGDKIFYVEASCDGLILLSGANTHFSICNPATRQYAPLRGLHCCALLGMYPHSPSGEYRLLLLMNDNGPGGPAIHASCHVFTLGSCQPPRNIGIGWHGSEGIPVPVLFRGSLHWQEERESASSSSNNNNVITVFDTTAESFRQMRSPVHGRLFELDDMLGIYSSHDASTIIDIWVSEDYEGELWAFKCRVELPVEEIRLQFQKFDINWENLVVACCDRDLHILVRSRPWLLQIDINGKVVASFHCERQCLPRVSLKQTLVLHTFFPTLEGYVVNEPPFI